MRSLDLDSSFRPVTWKRLGAPMPGPRARAMGQDALGERGVVVPTDPAPGSGSGSAPSLGVNGHPLTVNL